MFTDELAALHAHTLETHVNKARTGPIRFMPEYSYGVAPDWELSLQLPFAFDSQRAVREGYRVELQYIAPHDDDRGLYWGFNVELAREARLEEERFWNLEAIAIVGCRIERWHLVVNPGIERPLGAGRRASSATPAAKISYASFPGSAFGVEYYVQTGAERSRTVYLAWDGKIGKSDLNLGLGRGLAAASDRWVLKAIYEIAF